MSRSKLYYYLTFPRGCSHARCRQNWRVHFLENTWKGYQIDTSITSFSSSLGNGFFFFVPASAEQKYQVNKLSPLTVPPDLNPSIMQSGITRCCQCTYDICLRANVCGRHMLPMHLARANFYSLWWSSSWLIFRVSEVRAALPAMGQFPERWMTA